ncbi:MAG: Kelch repeat-containing protein, partial [Holophagaceae bacterium]
MTRLQRPRELHTATRLQDGRVLVAGGVWGEDTLRECEMYDPKQQAWKPVASMQFPRTRHTATLLPDGRVLVIGGSVGKTIDQVVAAPQKEIYASCEIYDPKTDRWTLTNSMNYPRTSFMNAVLLPHGRVLVGGGFGSSGYESNLSWEIYDITTEQWSLVGRWDEPIHG